MNEPTFFPNLKTLKLELRGDKHHTLLTLLSFLSLSIRLSLTSIAQPLLVSARVLGLPQLIEIDKRPDEKLRQGFIGPCCSRGAKNNVDPLAFLEIGVLVPYMEIG